MRAIRRYSKLVTTVAAAVVLMSCTGCGPISSQKDRWTWTAYDDKEWTQEKDDIVLENRNIQQFPPEFVATAQQCSGNLLVVDAQGQPVMQRVSLLPPGSRFFDVTLTNNTDHVLRLNRTVIRLFDPAGTQYEPLGIDELQAMLLAARPCPSTQQLLPQLKVLKLYNRNVEVVPKTSFTGYVIFKPASVNIAGTWKVALYEIPAKTDQAGKTTKTTGFEVRSVEKHYIDHYYQENAFAQPQLKSSEEVQ
jgi:hypothetical protein